MDVLLFSLTLLILGESIWGQCLYPSSKVFPPGHAPLDLPSASDSRSVLYIYSYSPQFDYISCGGYVSNVEYCFRRLRSSASSMQEDLFEMYFMNRVSDNSDEYQLTVDRVLKFGGHSSSDRQYNESCSNETDLYEICCAKENIIATPTNHLKDILLLKIAPYSSPNANTLLLAQTNNSVVTTSYDAASLNMTLILDIDDTSLTDLIPHFRLIISPTPKSPGSTQSALGIGLGLSAGGVTILICFMVIVTVVVCIVAKQRCVKVVSFQLEMEAREGVQEYVLGENIGAHSNEAYSYQATATDACDPTEHFETHGNEAYQIATTTVPTEQNIVDGDGVVAEEESMLMSVEEREEVYMVPAAEEHELYAQYRVINIVTIPQHKVSLTELLGSGQFGVVNKGVWQSPRGQVEVAVKMLKEGSDHFDRVKFLQEAAIMGQFRHHNIVQLYGVITEGESIMIVLELLNKGNLRQHLKSQPEDEELPHTLLSYCRQIISGINYLTLKSFVHRDLAARNILVSEDGTCKIADFGMSRDLMDGYYVSHGGKIPVKWTAPEALHYKRYTTASDVWSFGAVMYEIWSLGHEPFEGHTNREVMSLIEAKQRLPPPPGCPRAVYELMINCWHPESSSRPDSASIVQSLSRSDSKLLKWTEEDRAVHTMAACLGAELEVAQDLYKDLQLLYS